MSRYGCQEREKDPRLRISFYRERRTRGNHRAQRFGQVFLIKTLTKEYHPLAGAEELVLKIMGKETWHVFDLRKLLGIV
jgi:uncharacterized membrane protein YccC